MAADSAGANDPEPADLGPVPPEFPPEEALPKA